MLQDSVTSQGWHAPGFHAAAAAVSVMRQFALSTPTFSGLQVYRHKARKVEHVLVARTPHADFVGHTHGADRSGAAACMCAILFLRPYLLP